MIIGKYFEALQSNLWSGIQSSQMKELVTSLDAAYREAIDPPPKVPPIFGRFYLICHKSLLSAAATIAQAQPEDSVGTTRRAIEVARIALAIKRNESNALKWTAYQDRHDRWIRRQAQDKPKSFRVQLVDVQGDPMVEELDRWIGVLSDAYVHFTPEFYDSLSWVERPTESAVEIVLEYFQRDEREIERHFNLLAAVHGSILKSFDHCFDGAISGDARKLAAVNRFWATAKWFSEAYTKKYVMSERGE